MTTSFNNDTDQLLRMTADGNANAAARLLSKHRDRLRKLISVRLDSRVSARVDPSDVIQEALVDADKQLANYALERPLPFYPWLRQVTLARLAQVHRFHLQAQRRSVHREAEQIEILDQSTFALAKQLIANTRSPSEISRRQEEHHQLQDAISELSDGDREVLVLRYVEQLQTSDAAAVLGVSPNAFAQKHLRAVRRLRQIVDRRANS
ncbi:MAG: sigma-70 family RNA polymerase sigma factor [Planctomycetales bacterium]|nr:sigma-70 family RNA polymerase sigma factor [Planctomycetales bacterium]